MRSFRRSSRPTAPTQPAAPDRLKPPAPRPTPPRTRALISGSSAINGAIASVEGRGKTKDSGRLVLFSYTLSLITLSCNVAAARASYHPPRRAALASRSFPACGPPSRGCSNGCAPSTTSAASRSSSSTDWPSRPSRGTATGSSGGGTSTSTRRTSSPTRARRSTAGSRPRSRSPSSTSSQQLHTYLDQFVQTPPYHLVSSSLGGKVAVEFAVRYPQLVNRDRAHLPVGDGRQGAAADHGGGRAAGRAGDGDAACSTSRAAPTARCSGTTRRSSPAGGGRRGSSGPSAARSNTPSASS